MIVEHDTYLLPVPNVRHAAQRLLLAITTEISQIQQNYIQTYRTRWIYTLCNFFGYAPTDLAILKNASNEFKCFQMMYRINEIVHANVIVRLCAYLEEHDLKEICLPPDDFTPIAHLYNAGSMH